MSPAEKRRRIAADYRSGLGVRQIREKWRFSSVELYRALDEEKVPLRTSLDWNAMKEAVK